MGYTRFYVSSKREPMTLGGTDQVPLRTIGDVVVPTIETRLGTKERRCFTGSE